MEPFAIAAEYNIDASPWLTDDVRFILAIKSPTSDPAITGRDLRRARAVLQETDTAGRANVQEGKDG